MPPSALRLVQRFPKLFAFRHRRTTFLHLYFDGFDNRHGAVGLRPTLRVELLNEIASASLHRHHDWLKVAATNDDQQEVVNENEACAFLVVSKVHEIRVA